MDPKVRKASLRSAAEGALAESDRAVIIDDDSDDSNTDAPNRGKRQKILPPTDPAAAKKDGALVTVADELICPISQELPVDPVMALDGKIYERASIERWLKKHKRSPLTGLAMGKTLTPALHVRTIIETVVASGAIDEPVAKAWVENSEKETKRKALVAAAEQGDPDAIVELAVFYHGEGQEKECKKWITHGARLRDPYCMGQMAVYLSIAGLSANDSNRYGNDRFATDLSLIHI